MRATLFLAWREGRVRLERCRLKDEFISPADRPWTNAEWRDSPTLSFACLAFLKAKSPHLNSHPPKSCRKLLIVESGTGNRHRRVTRRSGQLAERDVRFTQGRSLGDMSVMLSLY
ncbi:hypothetical protein BaRGS_00004952 [Batillaria attramentaria]|uniref:Uncharacterized protein n=1 Tax=Batillaria attramentaria TaxID=370345 RepID=A0ABD0LXR3_9CAEN